MLAWGPIDEEPPLVSNLLYLGISMSSQSVTYIRSFATSDYVIGSGSSPRKTIDSTNSVLRSSA